MMFNFDSWWKTKKMSEKINNLSIKYNFTQKQNLGLLKGDLVGWNFLNIENNP